MSEEVRKSNVETIRDYLVDHPNATKSEVIAATGRSIHSPDLTKARKALGITWTRGQKAPSKVRSNGQVPVVNVTAKSPDGLNLFVGVLELAKLHGIDKVRQATEAVASI